MQGGIFARIYEWHEYYQSMTIDVRDDGAMRYCQIYALITGIDSQVTKVLLDTDSSYAVVTREH
jgi:hypothetical protein